MRVLRGSGREELNRLDGVAATVNFATETASVDFDTAQTQPEELLAAVEAAGYRAVLREEASGAAVDDPVRDVRRRLLVSLVLALPVLALAMIPPLQFDNWQWLAPQLATPVVLWGGWPFHRAAAVNLRHGAATMDTLISVGTLAALGWSIVALFFLGAGDNGMRMPFELSLGAHGAEIYLEMAAAVTVLILVGRFLEARAKGRAGEALRSLLELAAKEVRVLRGDDEALVPVDRLRAGDVFVVRPGEKIATHGIVVDGASAVDQALLTGESLPAEVTPGSEVAGATINTYGRLVVRATRVGAETALAQIARLVAQAQGGKAPAQRLADRVSAVFVPVVIAVAVATLAFWLGAGATGGYAFSAAVAVRIIACPCALGLATPTALTVGTGRGARSSRARAGSTPSFWTRPAPSPQAAWSSWTSCRRTGRRAPRSSGSRARSRRRLSIRSPRPSPAPRGPRSVRSRASMPSATFRAAASSAPSKAARCPSTASSSRGTVSPARRSSSATRSSRRARTPWPGCARSGSSRSCSPAMPRRRPARSPPRSGSSRCAPRCSRTRRRPRSSACRRPAASSRWSATASTTRPLGVRVQRGRDPARRRRELNPIVAAAAMPRSSFFVVTNRLRLRRFRSVR